MRQDIEFDAEGTTLRGWLYLPPQQSMPAPVVVMAHGYAGVKEMLLGEYASVFAQAGLAVLVYDHRNFGDSGGEPRQEIDPIAQVRDYRHAVSYAQTRSELDPKRIGIWGSSYSGGHVLMVAAIDRRVRCVVSQVPTISGYHAGLRRVIGTALPGMLAAFDADRLARFKGEKPVMVKMVEKGATGQAAAYSTEDTLEFMAITATTAPNWRNEVTLRSIEMSREYEPGIYVPRISPTPLLMIVASEDNIVPCDLALQAYQTALEPKQLLIVSGGHYNSYLREFERTSAAARDFYVEHLR
jgi:uncharacterized protein